MYVKDVQMDTLFLKIDARASVLLDLQLKQEAVYVQTVISTIIGVLPLAQMAMLEKGTTVLNVDNHVKHVLNPFDSATVVFKVSNLIK